MPGVMQSILNAIRGNDPKAIEENLRKLALERNQQAALDRAIRKCSIKAEAGEIDPDRFWSCVPQEFEKELDKPTLVRVQFTPRHNGGGET